MKEVYPDFVAVFKHARILWPTLVSASSGIGSS